MVAFVFCVFWVDPRGVLARAACAIGSPGQDGSSGWVMPTPTGAHSPHGRSYSTANGDDVKCTLYSTLTSRSGCKPTTTRAVGEGYNKLIIIKSPIRTGRPLVGYTSHMGERDSSALLGPRSTTEEPGFEDHVELVVDAILAVVVPGLREEVLGDVGEI